MSALTIQQLISPRGKVIAAAVALVALVTMATFTGASAPAVARAVLTVGALAGIGWWWVRAAKPARKFQMAPRLSVVSKAGLSQRTGLALVEVDGRAFLVVHGDGYAEICSTTQPKASTKARRATDSHPKFSPERER